MSKLRKVQFFRNSSVVTTPTSHSNAVSLAETAFNGQLANMADGELLLYRYQITPEGAQQPEPTVHTIVGVVRKPDSGTSYVEILANYDMLTSQFDSLDVTGYKQAYVSSDANGSSFTVQGIQENNGKIGVDSTQGVTINIDGTYNDSTNKIATQSTVADAINNINVNSVGGGSASGSAITIQGVQQVHGAISGGTVNTINLDGTYDASTNKIATQGTVTNAINALDVTTSVGNATVGGSTITVQGVKQTDGKIVDGDVTTINLDGTYDDDNNKIATQSTVANAIKDGAIQHVTTKVFSANTANDLILRDNDFVYNNGELGVNVQTLTSATNKIATMADIASLSGAMHYKGAIDTVSTSVPSAGDYYTAVIDGDTYYLHVAGTSGTATAITPEAGDTLIISGTSGITPLETGDMIVYGGNTAASANVVNTNITLGMGTGQVAANQTALTATQIVVAGDSGVQTTGYTIGGEVGAQSVTALPTAKQVYDAIDSLAVNSVSETVGVTDNNDDTATVTDTLTVDGTAAAGQAFTIAGGDGVKVTGNASTQTITVAADVAAHSHQINTTTVNTDQDDYNLLKVDANGELSVSDTWDCGVYS